MSQNNNNNQNKILEILLKFLSVLSNNAIFKNFPEKIELSEEKITSLRLKKENEQRKK